MQNSILEQAKVAQKDYMLQLFLQLKQNIELLLHLKNQYQGLLSENIPGSVECPYLAYLTILLTLKIFE